MDLWLVGEYVTELNDHTVWELIGVVDGEAAAIAACSNENHFIAPIKVGELVYAAAVPFTDCRYPKPEPADVKPEEIPY